MRTNRTWNRIWNVLLFVVTTALAACGGGDDDSIDDGIPAEELRTYCDGWCEVEVRCDGVQPDECIDGCVSSVAPGMRRDAFEQLNACRSALSCDEDTSSCWAEIEPSEAAIRFEAACKAGSATCGEDAAFCESGEEYHWAALSSPLLDDMTACFTAVDDRQDCAGVGECIGKVFMEYLGE